MLDWYQTELSNDRYGFHTDAVDLLLLDHPGVKEISRWCEDQFSSGWECVSPYDGRSDVSWIFNSPADAALFKLRWL